MTDGTGGRRKVIEQADGGWRIEGLDVARAKRYSKIRLALFLLGTVWSVVSLTWFGFSGTSARLRTATRERVPRRGLAVAAYVAAVAALSWLARLPLSYVGGYRVERAYWLTKQSRGGWLGEQVKGFAIGLVLQVPLVTGAYAVIRRRPKDWWLVLSAATVPLTVVLSSLAPVLIMPLFNRFEPLRNRALAERVKRLSDRAGVRIADVYQLDMSRQTEKANAFFTGLGNTKRIALGDTLLDQFPEDEVEAVVAHELGHQAHGDMWRLIGVGSALGFGSAYALHRLGPGLFERSARRTGVRDIGDEAGLPLLGLVMGLLGFFIMPLQSAFSRAIERAADRFALNLTENGEAYASAMARLASQNLADPDPPKPVVFFLYSHPPIAERIETARAFAKTTR